jgi:hypothetical protein
MKYRMIPMALGIKIASNAHSKGLIPRRRESPTI